MGSTVVFSPFVSALPVVVSAVIGILCLAAAVEGYLVKKTNIIERVLLAAAALMLLKPGLVTDVFGVVVLIGTYLFQKASLKKAKQA